jgi:hypothetical protein
MSDALDLGQAVDLTNLLDKSAEEKATQLPERHRSPPFF